jgi:two-component system nitrate/nitrite response regulator NarL
VFQLINIVITSDIRIYCEGLGQLLARAQDVNVTAITSSYESAIASVSVTTPCVLLLDMTMVESCRLATQVAQVSPETRVVALAVSYDESSIVRCAEAGVTCYVPREASVSELLEAVRKAARGECYCPPKIAACLLKKVQNLTSSSKKRRVLADARDTHPEAAKRPVRLTRREQQIAASLSTGLSNKEIARKLCIEVSTVKNHVHNLLVKLGVSNRSQAVFQMQNLVFAEGSRSMDLDRLVEFTT